MNYRRKRHQITLPLTEVVSLPGSSASLLDHMADEAVVQQALQQLTDKQRAVLILRYYGDLSYQEIAQVLEIPVGTVRSRLNAALKALHQALRAGEIVAAH